MRKAMKRFVGVAAVAALTGLAMASVASAADRLTVKNSVGAVQFDVQDSGNTGIGTATPASKLEVRENLVISSTNQTTPIQASYNAGILRARIRIDGSQDWFLNDGSNGPDNGSISYATPGGGVGISFFTSPTYNQNRLDISNFPTLGPAGTPVFHIGYSGSPVGITVTKTNSMVGIGTPTPTSKLQVVGLSVYANNAAAVAGGLTAGAFYRNGADPDIVCVVH
jgi:hypothetical protein